MTWFATKARKLSWLSCAVFASVMIDVGCATVIAHELGTTRVAILLNDGKTYDVEVDTSVLSPEECAEAIRRRLADGPPASAFERLAAESS